MTRKLHFKLVCIRKLGHNTAILIIRLYRKLRLETLTEFNAADGVER